MPYMGSITKSLKHDLGKMKGLSDKQILLTYSWDELSIPELWERLLRTNRIVQRLFSKQAFLIALD